MVAILYRREQSSGNSETVATVSSEPQSHHTNVDMNSLLMVLFVILLAGLFLGSILFFISKYRTQRKQLQFAPNGLPLPHHRRNKNLDSKNPLGLTVSAISFRRNSKDIEKLGLISHGSPMPMTPDSIPEIRITFPEEEDAQGRRKSGRVVIVQVGEAGVGFVRDIPLEQQEREAAMTMKMGSAPPKYSRTNTNNSHGFSSVDLERVGGLKEKDVEDLSRNMNANKTTNGSWI